MEKKAVGRHGYHTGVDLVGITNKTVYNVCDGTVIMAKYYGSYGNCVKVKDSKTKNVYLFGHLKNIAVRVGQKLTRTSKIGIMGNTGRSFGAHLHFEVRTPQDIYGKQYNPCNYLGIPNKCGQYSSKNFQIGTGTTHNTETTHGAGATYNVGDAVQTRFQVRIIADADNEHYKVENGGYEFVLHKTMVTDINADRIGNVIQRATIVKILGDKLYNVNLLDRNFDIKESYIEKKL